MEFKKMRFLIFPLAAILMQGCPAFRGGEPIQKESEEMSFQTYSEEEDVSEQFFVPNRDGYMYIEDADYMELVYEGKYTDVYPDCQSFKVAVLTHHVNPPLPRGMTYNDCYFDTYGRFLIDSTVVADFKTSSLEDFISKYCRVDDQGHLVFNDNYPDTERTVAYCLWLTGRYVYHLSGIERECYVYRDSTLNALYNYNYENKENR